MGSDGIIPIDVPAHTELHVQAWGDQPSCTFWRMRRHADVRDGSPAGCIDRNRRGNLAQPDRRRSTAWLVTDAVSDQATYSVDVELVPRPEIVVADQCRALGSESALSSGVHRRWGTLAA